MTQQAAIPSSARHDLLGVDDLLRLLDGTDEIALIDVREQGVHANDGHIIHSVSLPLSLLELRAPVLLPRRSVHVVVIDAGDGVLANRAFEKLGQQGYHSVSILQGGVAAWGNAGQQVYTGSSSYSKAFGEFVEETYSTPHLSTHELKAKLDAGEVLLVDGRTLPEFQDFSIPGAHAVPNGELPLRIHTLLKDPTTPVVVNCAGRTRSIIGAQALINAGLPNPVAALEDGTMAWLFEGLDLQYGRAPSLPEAAPERAKEAVTASVERLTRRFGIAWLDAAELARLTSEDAQRSLYLLDVRTRAEYDQGHLPGARWAEGGELVQGLDKFVGVRGARVVLLDDAPGVRAAITASWLRQLNRTEVFAYVVPAHERTRLEALGAASSIPAAETIDADRLAAGLAEGSVAVLDLATSLAYERGHIPGASFAVRSRLSVEALNALAQHGKTIVLTSSDGELAQWAVADLAKGGDVSTTIRALEGGTDGWREKGLPIETGATALLHDADDVWRSPYHQADRFGAFRTYLDWERNLLTQIRQDATVDFRVFPAQDLRA